MLTHLLPMYGSKTDSKIQVIAVSTGSALEYVTSQKFLGYIWLPEKHLSHRPFLCRRVIFISAQPHAPPLENGMQGTTTTSRIRPDSGQLGSSRRNCGPSSELPWRWRGGAGTSGGHDKQLRAASSAFLLKSAVGTLATKSPSVSDSAKCTACARSCKQHVNVKHRYNI